MPARSRTPAGSRPTAYVTRHEHPEGLATMTADENIPEAMPIRPIQRGAQEISQAPCAGKVLACGLRNDGAR